MKKISLLTFHIPLLLLFLSCGSHRETATPIHDPLMPQKDQTWQLVTLQGRSPKNLAAAPTLRFNPEAGTLSGFAYCNTYTFHYTLHPTAQKPDGDYHTLSLESWGGSSLGCPEADMNAESRFLLLLSKATTLRLTATTLTFYQRDKELLLFELQ